MLRSPEYTRVLNMSRFWIYQGHEYASRSEYARVLNKAGFWMYQDSEYASGSEFARVLNMSGLPQGSKYALICLIMSGWICLDMREYAQICLNGFCFIFPHCNLLSTWRRGYSFQRLHKTRSFSLNEKSKWGCFLGDTQFDLVAASILFVFYFRLNISISKISNLLLPLGIGGGGGGGAWGLWFFIYLTFTFSFYN